MINLFISSQSQYQFDRERMRQVVSKTLEEHGIRGEVEISLLMVGERKMRELHKAYMETDETTDVLSFPLEDSVGPDEVLRLGDIVVCYPVAVSQARDNNRLVDDEIAFLVEHSCLHLLGIHHE